MQILARTSLAVTRVMPIVPKNTSRVFSKWNGPGSPFKPVTTAKKVVNKGNEGLDELRKSSRHLAVTSGFSGIAVTMLMGHCVYVPDPLVLGVSSAVAIFNVRNFIRAYEDHQNLLEKNNS